jgi:hypothetical protein
MCPSAAPSRAALRRLGPLGEFGRKQLWAMTKAVAEPRARVTKTAQRSGTDHVHSAERMEAREGNFHYDTATSRVVDATLALVDAANMETLVRPDSIVGRGEQDGHPGASDVLTLELDQRQDWTRQVIRDERLRTTGDVQKVLKARDGEKNLRRPRTQLRPASVNGAWMRLTVSKAKRNRSHMS